MDIIIGLGGIGMPIEKGMPTVNTLNADPSFHAGIELDEALLEIIKSILEELNNEKI